MGAVGSRIEFEHGPPTIDEITCEFREATGLELIPLQYGARSYSLSSPLLKGDVDLDLRLGPVVMLVRYRARRYLEWGILRALQRLGGRVPVRVFPRYATAPWASLSWLRRWLHR